MKRLLSLVAWMTACSVVALACDSSDSDGNPAAGTSGSTSGTSGNSGVGGNAGTSGSAGTAGASGSAGSAGNAGTAGMSGGTGGTGGSQAAGSAGNAANAGTSGDAGTGGTGGTGGTTAGASGMAGSAGAPTAAQLLALVSSCQQVSQGLYATDDGEDSTVAICGLNGAVFWKADMDVDCDGKVTTQCNSTTDPAFQDQTSATDSHGDPLDASTLPYVVIPLPSSRFDYDSAGLQLGSVVAVIYNGNVVYGVFGDEGPDDIIGESSYAMAQALGIDPDPSFGGTDSGVTYIAFTGSNAVVDTIENHEQATTLGQQLATQLIQSN